jgi:hypothetical protein
MNSPPFTYYDAGMSQPKGMPCIAVVCGNCGYTEFYNVHALGVASLLGVPNPGVPIG